MLLFYNFLYQLNSGIDTSKFKIRTIKSKTYPNILGLKFRLALNLKKLIQFKTKIYMIQWYPIRFKAESKISG